MSITDELRHNIEGAEQLYGCECKHLLAIADRIDAEHEALRDQLDTSEGQKESYREDLLAANRQVHAVYNDGFDDGFASADDWLAQHEDAMAEHGWIRLPKDADDVPWSVGDRDEDGNTVTQLRLSSDGWYAVTDGPSAFHPEQRRHYHAHTVEDVLREFADGWDFAEGIGKGDSYMKTFAAKLRLAEED